MATFLTTHSYSSNTTIQIFYLPWWGYSYLTQSPIVEFFYSYQCLTTETSAQDNKGYTTETPSISYIISLYIRLVVIL